MDKVLNCEQLNVCYDKNPVLWDITLSIPKGKLVAIVGPNGAGKSTLLKTIVEIIKPLSGKVECFGMPFKRARKKIAYVPQKETVDWDFPITVLEVVLMGRYPQLGLFKWIRKADREAANNALKILGIEDLADCQISELSGGQQQRVFIARALVQDADLYLLDEPFSAVDVATEAVLVDVFKKLKEKGKTLIVVHHDLQSIETVFDSIILLNTRLIVYGDVATVFTHENLCKTYGKKEEIFTEMTAKLKKKKSGLVG
jgi:manganese/zinc/iron transport system ATP- binding protein